MTLQLFGRLESCAGAVGQMPQRHIQLAQSRTTLVNCRLWIGRQNVVEPTQCAHIFRLRRIVTSIQFLADHLCEFTLHCLALWRFPADVSCQGLELVVCFDFLLALAGLAVLEVLDAVLVEELTKDARRKTKFVLRIELLRFVFIKMARRRVVGIADRRAVGQGSKRFLFIALLMAAHRAKRREAARNSSFDS